MELFISRGQLHPTPPFRFALTLRYLMSFLNWRHELFATTNSLTKTITVNGQTVIFRLQQGPAAAVPQLDYTLISDYEISESQKYEILARISHYLGLYDNLRPLNFLARDDNSFRPLYQQVQGFHPPRFPSIFECLAWIVLTQGQSINYASTVKASLIEELGTAIQANGVILHAFPEPENILHASRAKLMRVLGSEHICELLIHVAEVVHEKREKYFQNCSEEGAKKCCGLFPNLTSESQKFLLYHGFGVQTVVPDFSRQFIAQYRLLYPQDQLGSVARRYEQSARHWAHYIQLNSLLHQSHNSIEATRATVVSGAV